MIDGNIKPNVLKQTAPINDMNGPIVGTAIDMATVKQTNDIRIAYSAKFLLSSEKLWRVLFQMISIGT